MKLNARQELKKTSLSPTAREALGKPKLSFLRKLIIFFIQLNLSPLIFYSHFTSGLKELSLCHKLGFLKNNFFKIKCRRP